MNPIRFLRTRRTRLLLAALVPCLIGSAAHGWWDNNWSHRKQLTLDVTEAAANVTEPLSDAPVLVRLHVGNFNFSAAREDGADIRFVGADDATPLYHHVAQYDPMIGEAFVWVKLPQVEPAAQQPFWLYYGNPGAGFASSARETYDADTRLIYHFGERGQPARDFSGNDNNALNAGLPVDGSLIGTGLHFDGKRSVQIPASESLRVEPGSQWTYSLWAKPAVIDGQSTLYARTDGDAAVRIGLNNGAPYAEVVNAGTSVRTPAGEPLAATSWNHIALVSNGETVTLYLNGQSYGNVAATLPALNSVAHIGAEADGSNGFAGDLVEFNIAATARPESFIRFAAQSQGGAAAAATLLYAMDEVAAGGDDHTGYFIVILESLTFDGWVVVVLCAFMAVISWGVMWGKNTYINTARKGNELFMKAFTQNVASDLTILDNADTHKISSMGGKLSEAEKQLISKAPLYRLYHVGAEEIRKRLEGGENGSAHAAATKPAKKSLSAHAIKSIGASLDGAQVREGQRLNRQIVLLTIAISGGPFLGLLGTVVGVMITFAAVAMAGDVNVNAIAPGIAAALLATVAGLGVAIPALFGYNYLLTRIKEISADMRVFADEFITKVAEFYPDNNSNGGSGRDH